CGPAGAADAVPGSVSIWRQPAGYASAAPDGVLATFELGGAPAGRSQPKALGGDGLRAREPWTFARTTRPSNTTSAPAADQTARRAMRLPLLLVAVAIARSAVVVGVHVAAVVLRDGRSRGLRLLRLSTLIRRP